VVVTVETHALAPSMFWGSFALSKQALLSLVAMQAREWQVLDNLRINALLPGPARWLQQVHGSPARMCRWQRARTVLAAAGRPRLRAAAA
jgi:NAD(P)-dependent dehydrogenase (short-subunit alcohol dehydrogenase family)